MPPMLRELDSPLRPLHAPYSPPNDGSGLTDTQQQDPAVPDAVGADPMQAAVSLPLCQTEFSFSTVVSPQPRPPLQPFSQLNLTQTTI